MRFKKPHQSRGAAAIEFAIVAVPMITIIFGCMEVTRLFMITSLAEDATFESLRHCIVAGAKKGEGIAEANSMLSLLGTQDATVEITAYEGPDVQNEIDDDTTDIEVVVTVPMSKNAFLLSAFTKNVEIKKSARMTTERYNGFYDGGATP